MSIYIQSVDAIDILKGWHGLFLYIKVAIHKITLVSLTVLIFPA